MFASHDAYKFGRPGHDMSVVVPNKDFIAPNSKARSMRVRDDRSQDRTGVRDYRGRE